jgi:hypothetical protein
MNVRLFGRALIGAGLLLGSACDALLDPGPDLVDESDLVFIRAAADAPPLQSSTVSFWIKRGETRVAQLQYTTYNGNGKCLLFRVPAEAPLRHADGSAFAVGDSALVTIRVTQETLFRFEFDPEGLEFDPAHPAELEIRYRWADPDYNGDGVIDADDARIESSFAIWHQDTPGEGWEKIRTTRLDDIFEARAPVTGFSQYALASN